MSPRASSTGNDEPAEEAPAPAEVPVAQQQMNEVMAATAVEETPGYTPPSGSDEVTAENVRRYPDLFTDDQKTGFDVELPATEAEQAAAES